MKKLFYTLLAIATLYSTTMFSSTTQKSLYDADGSKKQNVQMFTRDGESKVINPTNDSYYKVADNGSAIVGYTKGKEQTKTMSEIRDMLSASNGAAGSNSRDAFVNGCAWQVFLATYETTDGGYIADVSGNTFGRNINDKTITVKYTPYSPVRGSFDYDESTSDHQTRVLQWVINETGATTIYSLTGGDTTEPSHIGVRKNNKGVIVQNGIVAFHKIADSKTGLKIGGTQKGGESAYPCTRILSTDNSYWNAYRSISVPNGKTGYNWDGLAFCIKYCIEYDYLYGIPSDINFSS
jgi:hypothetical protein